MEISIYFFLVCNRYIQLYFELGIHHAADLFDCSLLLILTFVCVASSVMLRLSAMCIRIGTTRRPFARYATSASWHLLIALSASDFYKCQSIFCGESAWHFLYFFLLDRAIIAAVAAATSTTQRATTTVSTIPSQRHEREQKTETCIYYARLLNEQTSPHMCVCTSMSSLHFTQVNLHIIKNK